jgi:hypothetical protein
MNFFEIDSGFKLPEGFTPDLLDALPIHKHHYGQPMEAIPSSLYWTEYQPFQEGDGTISFARLLFLQYPEVAHYVVNYIQSFFPKLPIDYRRVNLLKTHGSIRMHKDESHRKCCINIGIKNSTGAITKTSSTLEHAIFESVAVAHQCQNGHAYLLDTSHLHRVMAINDQPRYLFTYGFGVTFEEVYKLYKPKVI